MQARDRIEERRCLWRRVMTCIAAVFLAGQSSMLANPAGGLQGTVRDGREAGNPPILTGGTVAVYRVTGGNAIATTCLDDQGRYQMSLPGVAVDEIVKVVAVCTLYTAEYVMVTAAATAVTQDFLLGFPSASFLFEEAGAIHLFPNIPANACKADGSLDNTVIGLIRLSNLMPCTSGGKFADQTLLVQAHSQHGDDKNDNGQFGSVSITVDPAVGPPTWSVAVPQEGTTSPIDITPFEVTAGDRSDELRDILLCATSSTRTIGQRKVCVYDIVNEYVWPSAWSAGVHPGSSLQSGIDTTGYSLGGKFLADDEPPLFEPPTPRADEYSVAAANYQPYQIAGQQALSAVGFDGGDSETHTKYDPMLGDVWTDKAVLRVRTVPALAFEGKADLVQTVAMNVLPRIYLHRAMGVGGSGSLSMTVGWSILSVSVSYSWSCTVGCIAQYAFSVDGASAEVTARHLARNLDHLELWENYREWATQDSLSYQTARTGTALPVDLPVSTEIRAQTRKYNQDISALQHGETQVTVTGTTLGWAESYPRIASHY